MWQWLLAPHCRKVFQLSHMCPSILQLCEYFFLCCCLDNESDSRKMYENTLNNLNFLSMDEFCKLD